MLPARSVFLGTMESAKPTSTFRTDMLVLCAIASVVLAVHFVAGNRYGFHRDELQFLHDARHLDFGFVAYPPMTALMGRVSIALFGISLAAFRLPSAIVCAACVVLTGLTARELGGRKPAQALAALMALPLSLAFGSFLMYNTPDWLAWSCAALFTARLLRTGNQRWWIAIGAAVGFGVLSKYSIAFLAVSLVAGLILFPSQRHHLRSRWFYFGLVTTLLIASPNLIWLERHHFLTIRMEQFIHARDVRIGRADGYYTDQAKYLLFALPVTIAGLVWLLRSARFRLMSLYFIGPFLLFALARGRAYYLLVTYVALWAAGAVALEDWLTAKAAWFRLSLRALQLAGLLLNCVAIAWLYAPLSSPGHAMWNFQMENQEDMREETGWPELAAQVAAVRDTLPAVERAKLGILAANYGEAGALELYGPRYGLPTPISHINSWQLQGIGPYVPETVIVVGLEKEDLAESFSQCIQAATLTNPYGIRNDEVRYHPAIFVCRNHAAGWREDWPKYQRFG